MRQQAENVQARVANVKNMDEVFHYAIDLMGQHKGKSLAVPDLNDQDRAILQNACEAQGIQILAPPLRHRITEIHTTLTFAEWGIAETGTLVLDSTSEDVRIGTMVAEIHLAILPASRIRPDAAALENELNALQQSSPRYMAFITGPSRTADIERVLTIGVHGPRELHILVMKETEQ